MSKRLSPSACLLAGLAGLALIAPLAAPMAHAETAPQFVRLGRIHGMLTQPDGGAPAHVAILYDNGDGTGQLMCSEMPKRGVTTLCLVEGEHPNGWEDVALEVKAGVNYLRSLPGITKVLLYAHSGGGTIASFYQAVAENGVAFCQDPKKLSRCSDALANLPPADGVIFADAHPGLAVMDMREINPSLHSDGRKVTIDPALDPYNPANGFSATGPSHYPPAFVQRYGEAQAAEMARLIEQATAIRAGIASGVINDPAADIIVSRAGRTSHLDELDPTIPATTTTQQPRRLLRNDGSITTQIIRSSMAPTLTAIPKGVMNQMRTLRTMLFFSRGSVKAKDSWTGVDWCSSNAVTMCNSRAIHVPILMMPSGANNFIGDGERMFDGSPAKDKDYIVVEGATHGGAPCTACEPTPGAYANAATNMFNYMRDWIAKRF